MTFYTYNVDALKPPCLERGPALPRAERSRRFSKACDSISMVQPLDDVETRLFGRVYVDYFIVTLSTSK